MGRAHGRIAYGWTRVVTPDGSKSEVVDESQAGVVRDLAQRIIRGDSLRGIVADLNARGIPSPTGKPWAKVMVRHLVMRERNVALRVHRGDVVGAADWPPILDRAVWEQVRAVLADPARKTSTGSAAKHLLSGLARCGVCGGPMRAGMNRSTASYRCADRSCVSRNRADVDHLVVGTVLARLARGDAAGIIGSSRDDDETARALAGAAELRGRLDAAADAFAEGQIDRTQLQRINERLRPRLEAAEARTRIVDTSTVLDGIADAPDPRAVWSTLPLSRQRAIIDILMTVRVLKTSPGAREFDPSAVEIAWRDGVSNDDA